MLEAETFAGSLQYLSSPMFFFEGFFIWFYCFFRTFVFLVLSEQKQETRHLIVRCFGAFSIRRSCLVVPGVQEDE